MTRTAGITRTAQHPARLRRAGLPVIITLSALLGGCASGGAGLGVQPWERGILARDDMALDAAPLRTAIDEHIYFSKEATSGGRGFAGGGCGCN